MGRPGAADLEALRDKARRLRRLGLAGSLRQECQYQQGRDDRAAGRVFGVEDASDDLA